ncbi:cellulose synthase complex outer membrane protein BcsC [Leminorella grimontii]|uniref:cellulose synthase complex outer membrane protein BcsC n=1 Tax=Leminorella grimontii TaxID=82981 RepID=UPI0021C2F0E4|nr:cellulose synthase complex outer membrane protein BcsC [Leminorella grimontii]
MQSDRLTMTNRMKRHHFPLSLRDVFAHRISFSLALLPFALSPLAALAADAVSPEAWLQEQIRLGEAAHRDDLVKESLYRLEKISPNSPETLSAQIHYALRQGDLAKATQLLGQLEKRAPGTDAYLTARLEIELAKPEGKNKLQQARLLATGGQLEQAKAAFDELFDGKMPTLDLAVEYWSLVSRIPGERARALDKLLALQKRFPASGELGAAAANALFAEGKTQQAYQVLESMAHSPAGAGQAADIWYDRIKGAAASEQSVAQLQRFISVFDGQPVANEARSELQRQQALLNDPAYRAKVRGLEMVEKGAGQGSIASLRQALGASPDDPELLTALGQAYARSGNRQQALAAFAKAKENDKNAEFAGKLDSLIQTNRYWLLIDSAGKALKDNRLDEAETLYRQAGAVDSTDAQSLIGLGDVALARNDAHTAESFYQRALRREPGSGSAVRSLVSLYEKESPEKALAYLQSLPASVKNGMKSSLNSLTADSLKQQAEALVANGRLAQAEEKYLQAKKLTPDDPWLTYRLANVMQRMQKGREADLTFSSGMDAHRQNAEWTHAYALYLSGSDRDALAVEALQKLPASQWDDGIRELSQRLKAQQVIAEAEQIRAEQGEDAAVAFLQQQPENTRINLTLAEWAMARNDAGQAQEQYRYILAREPDNKDALLGNIEAQIAGGQLDEAKTSLNALPLDAQEDDLGSARRLARAWSLVGEREKSESLYSQLMASARQPTAQPDMERARFLRDAASASATSGDPKEALASYKYAMAAYGISPTADIDDETFTRYMRRDDSDDWLRRGIKSDAESLYKQQSTTVTLDHDYWGSSGTGGISDLKAHTTMLHVAFPVGRGTGFLRTDAVSMDAGSFSTDSDGKYYEKFGTCYEVGCDRDKSQKSSGASVAAGWQDDRWQMDIGTTPMGFEVVDWVGGVSYGSDWRNLGWTLTASRRPVSSSLLSFGGAVDPNTGTTWGGVRKNGAQLDLSYDRGGPSGLWGNVAFHQLTGKNVADNERMQAMAGYYYKVVNETHRQVRVGVNTMWWHYQKDLSDYTLGQGGYYSPQQYLSLSLPVLYRERTENWSWEIGGSVSLSHAKTDGSPRYPLQGLTPVDLPDRDAKSSGSSSTGTGYTLRALIERKLTPHWHIGAGIDIQQAKDYTPSHGLVFLRYYFEPWSGDMDLPPQPLTPYADFK